MPVVLLRGARQTGKTTLVKVIQSLKADYTYLTFDHLPTLMAAKEDPVGFISRIEKPVILDEIQRVPELFLPIKSDVDERRVAGHFLLTGSADPLLLPKLGDSLAGRMRVLTLWPLSQGEILGKKETFVEKAFSLESFQSGKKEECSKEEILDRIIKGGYPTPLNLKLDSQRQGWFTDYVSLVLQKDILDLARIENSMQMPQLLMLLSSRIASLLNTEELARSLKMPAVTVHRYLDMLRTLFLVYLLPPWSGNLSKRIVKSSKIYLCDTALQMHLLNLDRERVIQETKLLGNLFENFVVLELIKQLSWGSQNISIFHYRDYSNSEIDIILENSRGDLVAIEIKASETVSKEDFKALKALQEAAKDRFIQGIVLYSGNIQLPFGKGLLALPISTLWC